MHILNLEESLYNCNKQNSNRQKNNRSEQTATIKVLLLKKRKQKKKKAFSQYEDHQKKKILHEDHANLVVLVSNGTEGSGTLARRLSSVRNLTLC